MPRKIIIKPLIASTNLELPIKDLNKYLTKIKHNLIQDFLKVINTIYTSNIKEHFCASVS